MTAPNILFVSYEFGPVVSGGVARVINGLCAALAGKVDFDIFLLQWRVEIDNFSGDLYRGGVDPHSYFTLYTDTVRELIGLHRYNVVHIMHAGQHTYEIVRCLRAAAVKVEIVFSLHSIMKYDRALRKASDQDLFHEEYLLKNSDHVHLLTETARPWVRAAYPDYRPAHDFHVIPNAIACPPARRPAWPRPPTRTVLSISRWSHGKGLEYLLDAIPDVLKVVPDAHFVLAGRKESSWENDVATYVRKMDDKIRQLAAHVTVFGWLDDAQKDRLCADAALVVMPSEMEYFPYAILEPAAEGIPLISSRIPGSLAILREDQDCLMYEPGDVPQLARHIVTLLGNPALAEQLARSAYQRVSTTFTWDRIGDLYRDCYLRALGTGTGGRPC